MTTVIKPTKRKLKDTEAEWYKYHKTLKEIVRLREEIMNPFDDEPDTNVGGGSNSVRSISKPTENVAIRLNVSKQLSYLTEITEAIEQVYNALPDDYKNFVRVRYWSGKDQTWSAVAEKCHINRATAFRWRDNIILATVELLGWR